jgi:hypothetical protein
MVWPLATKYIRPRAQNLSVKIKWNAKRDQEDHQCADPGVQRVQSGLAADAEVMLHEGRVLVKFITHEQTKNFVRHRGVPAPNIILINSAV